MVHALPLISLLVLGAPASGGDAVRTRLAEDVRGGTPLVAHVFVALCDNDAQGIVPVPRHLGNGQDPKSNLYWGARYGVAHYLPHDAGWTRVRFDAAPLASGVLERIVFRKLLAGNRTAYLVADAWHGRTIARTIEAFGRAAAGLDAQRIRLANGVELAAGGDAQLLAYVGHDALMELEVPLPPSPREGLRPRSAIVLACASKPYFADRLSRAGAHALLLTTNLMAPEAYTLDAAVSAWFAGATAQETRAAAARAYCDHQRCSFARGESLFAYEP